MRQVHYIGNEPMLCSPRITQLSKKVGNSEEVLEEIRTELAGQIKTLVMFVSKYVVREAHNQDSIKSRSKMNLTAKQADSLKYLLRAMGGNVYTDSDLYEHCDTVSENKELMKFIIYVRQRTEKASVSLDEKVERIAEFLKKLVEKISYENQSLEHRQILLKTAGLNPGEEIPDDLDRAANMTTCDTEAMGLLIDLLNALRHSGRVIGNDFEALVYMLLNRQSRNDEY